MRNAGQYLGAGLLRKTFKQETRDQMSMFFNTASPLVKRASIVGQTVNRDKYASQHLKYRTWDKEWDSIILWRKMEILHHKFLDRGK